VVLKAEHHCSILNITCLIHAARESMDYTHGS